MHKFRPPGNGFSGDAHRPHISRPFAFRGWCAVRRPL